LNPENESEGVEVGLQTTPLENVARIHIPTRQYRYRHETTRAEASERLFTTVYEEKTVRENHWFSTNHVSLAAEIGRKKGARKQSERPNLTNL